MLVIPVEDLVTSLRHAKANLRRFTWLKSRSQGTSASGSMDPFSFSLYNLCTEKNGIEIPVQLNGVNLLVELDTGAGVYYFTRDIQ